MNRNKKPISQVCNNIYQLYKYRINKYEEQRSNLENIVEIKIHGFYHFLNEIDMKNLGKWCVINQVMQEMHPQGYSLIEII